jgi:hypothetical protein
MLYHHCFALEYATGNVQGTQAELKFNRTYQLLAYADDVNLLGDNSDTVKKDTNTLLDAIKEIGLKINLEKVSKCGYLVNII